MRLARSFTLPWPDVISNGRVRAYLDVLVVGSGARMFGLASQFIVLLMLSHLLPKQSFGDMMAAFGFYRLAGVALGVGGSLVLLYHVSRRPDDRAAEIRLQRFSALAAALPSAALALITVFAATPVAAALGKPSLAGWLQHLAPFLVFTTLLIVATGALEGRSRVTQSIFWGEVAPNAVRIALLPLVALLKLPDAYVAHVLTLSVLLPWLWLGCRLWDRSVRSWQAWSAWDFSYSGKFMTATLFANQLGAADIVVASVLFPSVTVADYAVAARLAALFAFFQIALLKRFAPRAGRLLQDGRTDALLGETDLCRRLTIGATALTIGAVLLLSPLLLPLLGNYTSAGPLLVWLAIPVFVQSFYAASDRLLIIAGQANVALIFTASSFAVLAASPFATASWLGPAAIPAAMIFSMLAFNPLIAVRARQLTGVRTIMLRDAVLMACGSITLAAAALSGSQLSAAISYVMLGVIAVNYLVTAAARSIAYGDDGARPLRVGASAAGQPLPVADKAPT
jgi:O-antigen/teichoic acid export membrane protein